MIISASRRTDIPRYYYDWLLERIREGFVCTGNPFNSRRISRISLKPEQTEGIVFWTKNPIPMLGRLEVLEPFPWYIQFTLTGYGEEIEPGLPSKRKALLPAFQTLSRQVGKERVIWRYDPIFFNHRYTEAYHIRAFKEIAETLSGSTDKVIISFMDMYAKIERAAQRERITEPKPSSGFLRLLKEIAEGNHMEIETCAEAGDYSAYGIGRARCIDTALLSRISGREVRAGRDKNQRKECGCAAAADIGAYDTCPGGCLYCYANSSRERIREKQEEYDVKAPLLCGHIRSSDIITDRDK